MKGKAIDQDIAIGQGFAGRLRFGDKGLVFDSQTGQTFSLHPIDLCLAGLLAIGKTSDQLTDHIARQIGIGQDAARRYVNLFLSGLRERAR